MFLDGKSNFLVSFCWKNWEKHFLNQTENAMKLKGERNLTYFKNKNLFLFVFYSEDWYKEDAEEQRK